MDEGDDDIFKTAAPTLTHSREEFLLPIDSTERERLDTFQHIAPKGSLSIAQLHRRLATICAMLSTARRSYRHSLSISISTDPLLSPALSPIHTLRYNPHRHMDTFIVVMLLIAFNIVSNIVFAIIIIHALNRRSVTDWFEGVSRPRSGRETGPGWRVRHGHTNTEARKLTSRDSPQSMLRPD